MKQLFIVGCGRSGTTLLQSMLGCSPGLMTTKETQLFAQCMPLLFGRPVVLRSLKRAARKFVDQNDLPRELAEEIQLFNALTPMAVTRSVLRLLSKAAEAMGMSNYLEKTPRHLYYIPLLERAIADGENIEIIHMIREGSAVSASILGAWPVWGGRPNSVERATSRWLHDVHISASCIGRPRHHFVIYEDLVNDPNGIAMELARRVAIPLSLADLARRPKVAERIRREDEVWKREPGDGSIRSFDRSRSHVAPEILEAMRARIDLVDYTKLRAAGVLAAGATV